MMLARISAVIVGSLLVLPSTSQAAAVILWPVDPKIAANERATALWIENKGDEPITMQIRTMRWSQGPEGDRYENQDEVVASPPIAVVAAGKRQLIRVLRREQPGSATHGQTALVERSYRLLIDEIPTASTPNATQLPAAQFAVQMRYSVPLFAYAGSVDGARPDLISSVENSGSRRTLAIHNAGTLHARLVDIRTGGGGRAVIASGLAGYVLAGQTMRWPLPNAVPEGGQIIANVNGADEHIGSR